MKSILLLTLVMNAVDIISQTALQGAVLDYDTREALVFANVSLYQNGELILETTTDFDGFFSLTEIDPGEYQVLFHSTGYNECFYHGIRITSGNIAILNGALSPGTGLERYNIYLPEVSQLFQQFGTTSGNFITPRAISKLPFR